MFTRDQIEEIKKKLIMLGTKDTQFPDAHKLNGEEIIAIVQDGENKKIPLSSIINDDFINVSKDTTEILTLSTAVSKIDINNRKLGQVITFKDSANSWAIRQFTGNSLDNWNDISLWKSISGIDELKSQVETNAEDISVLSDEIERHDASILNLGTEVSKLKDKDIETSSSLSELATRVDTLKSQADTNTSNISSLNTDVSALQSKVDENTTSISQINNNIADHDESITQINTKLEEHTESINAKITTDRISDGAVTSEKIATSAFDSTLSVSGKIAPADVIGEKLTELGIEAKEQINQIISTFAELLDFQSIQSVNVVNGKYIDRNGKMAVHVAYKINVYSVVPGFYIILNNANGTSSLTADYAFVGDVNCNNIVSTEQWETKQYYTFVKIPSGVQYLAINWDGSVGNLRILSTANPELLINPQIVNQAIGQTGINKQAIGEIDGVLPKSTTPLTLVSSIDGYPSSPSGIIGGDSRWKTDIYSINGALKLKLEHKCNTPNFVIVFSNSTTINTDTIIGAVAYNSTTGANTQQDIDVPSGAMYVGVYRGITNFISSYSYVNFGEKINDISTPAYNYNKWFNLWGQLPVPNSNKTNTGIWGNVEVGSDFNAFGASRYIKFDKTSEQTNFQIFTLAKEDFRQDFISGKKIKIEFLLKSSAALKNQTFSIYYMHGNYQFGILTSTQITTNANEIKKVKLTAQVPDTDIDTTQYLTFYFTGVASSIYKIANIIITDVVDTNNPPQNIISKNDLRVDLREYDLQNKECIYIGDSISTGYYWREFLESEYMLKYVRNKSGLTPAEGGIKVMPVENEESATQKSIWYRCANNRMANYQFDIISLMGGTNDMNISDETGFAVGTINDKPYVDDAASFDTPSNYVDIWSNNLTFAQCLMGCVEMLRRDFPEKPIILGTVMPCDHSYGNTEVGGIKLSERIAMLQMNIAEKYGIFCVPLYWGARNTTTIDSFSIDGVHPNKQQGRIMMAEYAKILCL